MRRRGRWGLIGRIQLIIRRRPVVAAVVITAVSLLLVGGIVSTTSMRCGPARALGLTGMASGCHVVASLVGRTSPTPFALPTPEAGPIFPKGNPASGPYPPDGNQASGPYPPAGNPASLSGNYPPFYPPASNGSVVTVLPLDCRLPVFAGPPGSGGFIVFPGGTFIADPRSGVTLPSPAPSAPPGGPGYGGPFYPGLSYDRQFSRWVPVPASWVSPDGGRYAYAASDGIYVVNVADNTQTELGEGHPWNIVAVQTQGVYAGNPGVAGLWYLPFSGTPRQITAAGYWQAASSSAAYGTATSAVPQGAANTIVRLDLKTGASTDWFSRPATQSSVTGLDGKGDPIINVYYVNGAGNEIWIATGPTSASAIAGYASGPYQSGGFSAGGTPIADSHGVWFSGNAGNGYGSASGVALYVAGSGLYWMSGIGGQLAGGCY